MTQHTTPINMFKNAVIRLGRKTPPLLPQEQEERGRIIAIIVMHLMPPLCDALASPWPLPSAPSEEDTVSSFKTAMMLVQKFQMALMLSTWQQQRLLFIPDQWQSSPPVPKIETFLNIIGYIRQQNDNDDVNNCVALGGGQ